MIDKIIEFLDLYLSNIEENIKKNGKFSTISAGLVIKKKIVIAYKKNNIRKGI